MTDDMVQRSADPSVLTTAQLFREAASLTERLDRQGDAYIALNKELDVLGSDFAALASKQDGDIKRLSSEITWSNRSVDSALKSHSEVHALNEKHVDIAREQQQFKNDALNNWRASQSDDRKDFALKDTVQVEMSGLRSQMETNNSRIRELELSVRAVLAEDSGAAGHKRSGQATVQQLMLAVGLVISVVAVIVTIVIANVSTSA